MLISFRVYLENKRNGQIKIICLDVLQQDTYFHAWKCCIDEVEPVLTELGFDWYIKMIASC